MYVNIICKWIDRAHKVNFTENAEACYFLILIIAVFIKTLCAVGKTREHWIAGDPSQPH